MHLPTSITLQRDHVPVFPDMCIVCHHAPDSTVRIAHTSQNPLLMYFVPILLLFGWSHVEVPICRTCKTRYRLQRWGRDLFLLALAAVAIWFIAPHFRGWHVLTRKLAIGALAMCAISPYILFEVLWPRSLNTTASKHTIDYDFSSSEYAARFRELNRGHVVKA